MTTPGELLAQLGLEFKYWRLERGMTQEQLAIATGISLSSIRRIEENGPVKYEHGVQIASALGVPLSEMTRRAEDAFRLRVKRDGYESWSDESMLKEAFLCISSGVPIPDGNRFAGLPRKKILDLALPYLSDPARRADD